MGIERIEFAEKMGLTQICIDVINGEASLKYVDSQSNLFKDTLESKIHVDHHTDIYWERQLNEDEQAELMALLEKFRAAGEWEVR